MVRIKRLVKEIAVRVIAVFVLLSLVFAWNGVVSGAEMDFKFEKSAEKQEYFSIAQSYGSNILTDTCPSIPACCGC